MAKLTRADKAKDEIDVSVVPSNLKVGDYVWIYTDPITRSDPEGFAILVAFDRSLVWEVTETLEKQCWEVAFEDDNFEAEYMRDILVTKPDKVEVE